MQILNEKQNERIESQKSKDEFLKLNELQEFLEECELKVWREVIPDECMDWTLPYSVDLIFEIEGYGYVAVEGKNINTHGQGGVYAEAYLQIRDKYKNKHYFGGKRIRRWCVLGLNSSDMGGERVECFIKHFFNKLGISFLQIKKYNSKKIIVIDSLTPHRLDIEKGIIRGIEKISNLDYGEKIK